ncbi:MAG: transposase, partial [Bdellovibrio sp.]
MDGSIIKANASLYAMKERDEEKADDKDDPPPPSNGAVFSKDGFSNNDFRQRNVEGKKLSNKTHVNTSDPEATLSGKAFESKSLAYKAHHTIDADSRVIVDCHVTTGIVSEVKTALDRVDAVQRRLQMHIEELIADRGYGSAENLESLSRKDIKTNIPLWSSKVGETFSKELEFGFNVDVENKKVFCPEGHEMKYSSDDRTGRRSLWTLKKSICGLCPRAKDCMTDHEYKHRSKRLAVPDHYELFKKIRTQQEDPVFRKKLWQRMWKMEGIFAEAKSFHGLRRARYRGRAKVQMQVYMISTVQNLKRLANNLYGNLTSIFEIFESWLFA